MYTEQSFSFCFQRLVTFNATEMEFRILNFTQQLAVSKLFTGAHVLLDGPRFVFKDTVGRILVHKQLPGTTLWIAATKWAIARRIAEI